MKCRRVQLWLPAARSPDELPAPVRRHLERCSDCGQHWHRLQRLDEQARKLPLPPESSQAKDQLRQRLDRTCRCPERPAPSVPRRFTRWMVRATASLLLGLGLFAGLRNHSPQQGMAPQGETPADRMGHRAGGAESLTTGTVIGSLGPHLAKQDVRLAGSLTPTEQLDVLMEMADALRAAAILLADPRGGYPETPDELALVVDLYGQVIQRGVAGRVRSLPGDVRQTLVPELTGRLQKAEKEIAALSSDLLPAAAHYLLPVARSAQEASRLLHAEPNASQDKSELLVWGSSPPLLAVLVLSGLRLAEEPDLLRRANIASELAQQLALAVTLVSAGDDSDQGLELAMSLGLLLEQGVSANLVRAEASDPRRSRQAEAEQVRQRAAQAAATLERNLARAPPAARAGLQRALEAVGQGPKFQDGKGQPKHPGPGHPPFVPPGHRKKATAGPPGPPWTKE